MPPLVFTKCQLSVKSGDSFVKTEMNERLPLLVRSSQANGSALLANSEILSHTEMDKCRDVSIPNCLKSTAYVLGYCRREKNKNRGAK